MPTPPQPVHHGLYDHGLYPFVFDTLFPIEGSPCGYGFIDLCQNSQMQIDIMQTAFLKNTMVGGNAEVLPENGRGYKTKRSF